MYRITMYRHMLILQDRNGIQIFVQEHVDVYCSQLVQEHDDVQNRMMYLEQDDVQLRQEVQGQCDVGGEREADAGRDHLDKKMCKKY